MKETILKNEERAVFALRSLYRSFGYQPYKMSRFEEYDLYVRNKDFLMSDRIITFSDSDGRLLALKPDVTLSIVKNAPQTPGAVQKVYYNENVYRDYREIMQTGLECVGDLGRYEIAEAVLLAARSLELLGDRFVLNLSHMGLVSAVLADFDPERRAGALECLRRKNSHELQTLCGEDTLIWEKLDALIHCRGTDPEQLQQLKALLTGEEEQQALDQLLSLWQILDSAGCAGSLRLDVSVGSDMGYYSGVVFQGYLPGIPTAVLSGGQYDKLPHRLGRSSRAIGFAIYLDLLSAPEEEEPVDTLILHDAGADPAALMEAARAAALEGTVLVSAQLPSQRRWRRLVDFRTAGRA